MKLDPSVLAVLAAYSARDVEWLSIIGATLLLAVIALVMSIRYGRRRERMLRRYRERV